ncbi:MAG: hypothetical protein KAT43_02400 [Nanoarchaeota archaeon]|nr:hypothetical protein [Nanoarchaeota archaeon]
MIEINWLLIVICALITGLVCSVIAHWKGYEDESVYYWFLIGAVIGIFGILIIVLMKNKKKKKVRYMAKENKPTHTWGIAGLVLGIIGLVLVFAPYIGIATSILAVVFYGVQKKHKPTGAATAGLVIGIIGIVLNSLMLIFIIGVIALFGVTT